MTDLKDKLTQLKLDFMAKELDRVADGCRGQESQSIGCS